MTDENLMSVNPLSEAETLSWNALSTDAISGTDLGGISYLGWNDRCHRVITVNSFEDEVDNNGQVSLREAIDIANQNLNDNIKILMQPGTYFLTRTGSDEDNNASGDLDIANRLGKLAIVSLSSRSTSEMTDKLTGIDSHEPLVTIDASMLGDRVFDVFGGDVQLSGLQLTGGSQVDGGGGILNRGNLTIGNLTISDCSATIGGGILSDSAAAKLTVKNSNISNNNADYRGGGVQIQGGAARIINSIISNNQAVSSDGGGVFAQIGSEIIIKNSDFFKNFAGFSGGGITSDGAFLKVLNSNVIDNVAGVLGGGISSIGTLKINDSLVSRNSTGNRGGGGLFIDGDTKITNTEISHNSIVPTSGPQFYGGGGIYVGWSGQLTLKESSIIGNTSTSSGGGIFSFGTIRAINTNISGNQAINDDGGGIWNSSLFGGVGNLEIKNSVIENNVAQRGGGLFNGGGYGNPIDVGGGTVTIKNSKIFGNKANVDGGGIWNNGLLTVRSSIVEANIADSDDDGTGTGGGIYDLGLLTLSNNIISQNIPDNTFIL